MATTPLIRRFRPGDEELLYRLFFETIRHVNRRDYSDEQVRAWAPDEYDRQLWAERIQALNPFVCEVDGEIAGYADVQANGYIDHFYVDRRLQRLGVGTALMRQIEQEALSLALEQLSADVSITARPFFEHFGFRVVRRQQITIGGVTLDNFRMARRTN